MEEETTLYGKTGTGEGDALSAPTAQRSVTEESVGKAMQTMQEYRSAKSALEERIKEEELWWRIRHWEAIRKKKNPDAPEPASAWLFNAVCNKHADIMDNFPIPDVLPRESADEEEAKKMSSILPCIMDACGFEESYSAQGWEKLKHGTGTYFVGWDPDAESGLGDIDVHGIDLLDLYWEPGVSDIQKSRNIFIASLADTDLLEQQYPQFKGMLTSPLSNDFAYSFDPNVKLENKSLVVDWYYKQRVGTREIVQYVKFCGKNCVLYASEDYQAEDGSYPYRERGYYDHGRYPVELDPLFPEKGTPVGFGMIAVTKSPQMYIDKLGANILEHSLLATKTRYMVSDSADINEDELRDANVPLVHSALSQLDDSHVRPITVPSLDGNYITVMQQKIDELKETSANRDFNNGGTSSGVTAAAAISALQESGNKVSRDLLQASYRSYQRICDLVIENIRQFYTEAREFRITGEDGSNRFVSFSNAGIRDQVLQYAPDGVTPLYVRRPVFDLKIRPQKRSPFSIEAQYERAKELFGLGFFDPQRAQEAMIALSMMDFEGKDKIVQQVQQGQTLYNLCQQLSQQLALYKGLQAAQTQQSGTASAGGSGSTIAGAQQQAARSAMTDYGQKLAQRSTPSVTGG